MPISSLAIKTQGGVIMTNDISILNKLNTYNNYENKTKVHKSKDEAALASLTGANKTEASFFTKTKVDPVNLTGDKILEKINEKLREKYHLNEPQTAESTNATNILEGVDDSMVKAVDNMMAAFGSLYVAYNKGHNAPDTEEMLNDFMNAIRKGVKEGYDEAIAILKYGNEFTDAVSTRVETFVKYLNTRIDEFETEKLASIKTNNGVLEAVKE